jgi:hypothetical protein
MRSWDRRTMQYIFLTQSSTFSLDWDTLLNKGKIMNSILIATNGEETKVAPGNKKHFSLVELQAFVGGYIQVITLADGRLMVLNEEGKLDGLEPNLKAMEYAEGSGLAKDDFIVGNVVVMPSNMME